MARELVHWLRMGPLKQVLHLIYHQHPLVRRLPLEEQTSVGCVASLYTMLRGWWGLVKPGINSASSARIAIRAWTPLQSGTERELSSAKAAMVRILAQKDMAMDKELEHCP